MGLLTGLLTLPLAPVRGTVWLAERVLEQAEREAGDEAAVRRRLLELEMRHDLGEIDDAEYAREEDELLTLLARSRLTPSGNTADKD
jgi:Gas vesicle protein G